MGLRNERIGKGTSELLLQRLEPKDEWQELGVSMSKEGRAGAQSSSRIQAPALGLKEAGAGASWGYQLRASLEMSRRRWGSVLSS